MHCVAQLRRHLVGLVQTGDVSYVHTWLLATGQPLSKEILELAL